MVIGLVDADSHNFPNLPLMKLSGWHKAQGDQVKWYNTEEHFARVAQSGLVGHRPSVYVLTNFLEYIPGGSAPHIRIKAAGLLSLCDDLR